MLFYLGTHRPMWLERLTIPLFVSHRTLRGRRRLPVAAGRWSLDSGGFTELSKHGKWVTTANEYEDAVGRYQSEIGGLDWCAPRDYMCEPFMLEKTGLSVREHQERTVADYLDLSSRGMPVIPVLQGWTQDEYHACVDLYTEAGVDLCGQPVVGLGSVCRRQNTTTAASIVYSLHQRGLNLHGFGFKTTGLIACGDLLASADSMAWSYTARWNPPLAGHTHKSCANCLEYALQWRERMLDRIPLRIAS